MFIKSRLKALAIAILPLVILSLFLCLRIDHVLGIDLNTTENAFFFKLTSLLLSAILFFWLFLPIRWQKVEEWITLHEKMLLIVIISAISLLYMIMSFNLHLHFSTHTFDLGIYDRAAWQYGQLNFGYFENIVAMRKMADHFEPILFIPGLFYWIFRTPYILLVFEAIVVAFGFLALYLSAKKILKSPVAAISIGLAFVVSIGVLNAINYPVHPGTYLATFYGFMLYFALENKFKWYYLFLLLALLSKESASLHLLYIGIFLLIFLKNRKHGLITILVGIAWYLLTIKMIMPALSNGTPYVHGVFGNISNNPVDFVKFVVLHPIQTLQIMFDQPIKSQTFWVTLASSGFLTILTPAFWLLVFPMLFERLITEHSGMISTNFHYGIPVAVMLFFSTIWSIRWLSQKTKRENFVIYLALYVFLCSLLVPIRLSTPLRIFKSWDNFSIKPINKAANEMMIVIPKDASILAQESLVPHLDYREKIGMYAGEIGDYEYVLLSKDESFPSWPLNNSAIRDAITNLRQNKAFEVNEENDFFILFKRM